MKRNIFEKVSVGSWITIGHPAVAEIMAGAGFDWLTVDLEHSAINIGQAEELIRVIDLKGVPAFVLVRNALRTHASKFIHLR